VLVFTNPLPSLSSQIPSLVLLSPIAALRLAVLLLSVTPGAAGKDPLLHHSLFQWAEKQKGARVCGSNVVVFSAGEHEPPKRGGGLEELPGRGSATRVKCRPVTR
jgi:hypothetical protein